jgi:hypothetical protein
MQPATENHAQVVAAFRRRRNRELLAILVLAVSVLDTRYCKNVESVLNQTRGLAVSGKPSSNRS